MLKDIEFEWDHDKDLANQEKHGVSFHQAIKAFSDPKRIIRIDAAHSEQEKRFYCFGQVDEGIMTVRFTLRGHKIRIFGAGYWRKGKKDYEQRNKIH